MVVSRTCIEGNYYCGINCSNGTRSYISDTMIGGGRAHPIIAFDNSRFIVRNSTLNAMGGRGDPAIYAWWDGVRFCVEDTTVKGFQHGIKVGKNVQGSVARCKFKDMNRCGIDNDGYVETDRNTFAGTGQMSVGKGITRESSKVLVVNKYMLK